MLFLSVNVIFVNINTSIYMVLYTIYIILMDLPKASSTSFLHFSEVCALDAWNMY